jgi:pyruvate/2-oxoglutarate dehydrogenase complex dihydrolipoamide dehydrogenase (E3) component
VEDSLRRDGVQMHLGCDVRTVETNGPDKVLHLGCGGEERSLAVDAILVGAGRQPNVEGLNLEAAGVAFDPRRGVVVNDRLQTTNRRIYAAGDVCSPYRFTHAADALARIVVQNSLFLGRRKASALTIPWCTYTDPELAHVGLTEREAAEKGVRVTPFVQELEHVDRAVLDGESAGFVRVLVRTGGDRIVGATVVAAHAGEVIAEITLAMARGVGLGRRAGVIHPYPTQADAAGHR